MENKRGKIQQSKLVTASGYCHCLSCCAIKNSASQAHNFDKTHFLTSTALGTETKGSWRAAITSPPHNICFTLTCSS